MSDQKSNEQFMVAAILRMHSYPDALIDEIIATYEVWPGSEAAALKLLEDLLKKHSFEPWRHRTRTPEQAKKVAHLNKLNSLKAELRRVWNEQQAQKDLKSGQVIDVSRSAVDGVCPLRFESGDSDLAGLILAPGKEGEIVKLEVSTPNISNRVTIEGITNASGVGQSVTIVATSSQLGSLTLTYTKGAWNTT